MWIRMYSYMEPRTPLDVGILRVIWICTLCFVGVQLILVRHIYKKLFLNLNMLLVGGGGGSYYWKRASTSKHDSCAVYGLWFMVNGFIFGRGQLGAGGNSFYFLHLS